MLQSSLGNPGVCLHGKCYIRSANILQDQHPPRKNKYIKLLGAQGCLLLWKHSIQHHCSGHVPRAGYNDTQMSNSKTSQKRAKATFPIPGQAVLFAANSLYLSCLERPLLCWSGESGAYVSTKAGEFPFRVCKIWGPLLQPDSPPRLVCMRDLQQPKRTAQQCWLANTVRVSDYSTQKMVGTLIADTQASNSLNTYKGRIAPTSAQRNSAKAGKWVHSIAQTPAQHPSH